MEGQTQQKNEVLKKIITYIENVNQTSLKRGRDRPDHEEPNKQRRGQNQKYRLLKHQGNITATQKIYTRDIARRENSSKE